jgi:hypothetical protein
MRVPSHAVLASFVALGWLGGCASILDIEQAHVDERAAQKEHTGTQVDAATSAPGSDGGASADGGTLCERYCSLVMTNCRDAFAQYSAPENCLAACQALPEGTPGDQSGNSIQCRLRNAELAPTEPPTYCSAAGPSGGGVCGTVCEAYCTMMDVACSTGYFADDAACELDCTALPDLGSYTVDSAAAMFRGEHQQCRLYHVNAALLDADFHCPHAYGGLPCEDENEDY